MTGYRQHSFDPNAYEQPGPPLRPYNWVQWTGVALLVAALLIYAVYFAGRAGLIAEQLDSAAPGIGLGLAGVGLINSRRQPSTDPAPELAAARKRWLIVTGLVCALVLGAAAFIEFQGA